MLIPRGNLLNINRFPREIATFLAFQSEKNVFPNCLTSPGQAMKSICSDMFPAFCINSICLKYGISFFCHDIGVILVLYLLGILLLCDFSYFHTGCLLADAERLLSDAELPEYFLERFFCCDPLFAGDVGEMVDDHAEVFGKEVAAETDVHGVDDTLQTFVGTEKG